MNEMPLQTAIVLYNKIRIDEDADSSQTTGRLAAWMRHGCLF